MASLLWLLLAACDSKSTPESCQFTEKLAALTIDEKRELLFNSAVLSQELQRLEALMEREEHQRRERQQLINSWF